MQGARPFLTLFQRQRQGSLGLVTIQEQNHINFFQLCLDHWFFFVEEWFRIWWIGVLLLGLVTWWQNCLRKFIFVILVEICSWSVQGFKSIYYWWCLSYLKLRVHYKIYVLELTEGWREENPVANLCDQSDNLCVSWGFQCISWFSE